MIDEPTLCDEDASVAIKAVCSELARLGKKGAIAVVDSHGETIAVLRQHGAALSTTTIAINKAFTAARLRRPSSETGRRSRDPEQGFDLAYFGDDRYVGFAGGMPVIKNGAVTGAIGVSGLTQPEDEELAAFGVAAILARNAPSSQ